MKLRRLVVMLLAGVLLWSGAAMGAKGSGSGPAPLGAPSRVAPGQFLTTYGIVDDRVAGRPDQPITWLEALVLLARSLGLEGKALALMDSAPYEDVHGQAAGYAALAVERGWWFPASPTWFGAGESMTVVDALWLMHPLLGIPEPAGCEWVEQEVALAIQNGVVSKASPLLTDVNRPILRREFYELLSHMVFELPLASGRSVGHTFLDRKPWVEMKGSAVGDVYTLTGKAYNTRTLTIDDKPVALSDGNFTFQLWNTPSWHTLTAAGRGGNTLRDQIWISAYGNIGWQSQPYEACDLGPANIYGKQLERAIREEAGQPAGILMICDLQRVTRLRLGGLEVENLFRLEQMVNLVSLDLSGVDRSGLWSQMAGLAKLPRLQRLDLSGTRLGVSGDALEWVSGLTGLTQLNISNNFIEDLTPLQSLTNLKTLYAAKNMIVDLSPLEQLTSLYDLNLSGNRIESVAPLVANFGQACRRGEGRARLDLSYNRLDLDDEQVVQDLQALIGEGLNLRFQPQAP